MLKFVSFSLLFLVSFNTSSQDVEKIQNEACGLNEKSRALAMLIMNDPKQNRKKLKCSLLLSQIAQNKVKEMAESHRVRHGAANRRLIDEGYPLSDIYPRLFENNVEAVAGGISNPEQMWASFKDSEEHRTHLLAEHEFYMLQDEIGVGFISDPKSPHVEYWTVYVAHKAEETKYEGEIAKSKDKL